jgi:hypothetical protein
MDSFIKKIPFMLDAIITGEKIYWMRERIRTVDIPRRQQQRQFLSHTNGVWRARPQPWSNGWD